ncbi:glycosyltransferase [Candidatus Pelagibacter ubique]|nr:glycosyltransferase [Candidatus Pelagibacter ubique]
MNKNNNNSLKFFLWSPMLSNVGTNGAMIGMAKSLKKYSDAEIYLVNILGEFTQYKKENFFIIDFLKINDLIPKTGKISKYLILIFSILSIPFLIRQVLKYKPDIIITGLVGFIPCILKFFFKDLIVINSIQGYPKFNFIRKFIWKMFYKKSDYLITMTKQTKKDLEEIVGIDPKKIFTIENPILNRNIKMMSLETIDNEDKFIFNKKVFCAIGRLTHQKNFMQLLKLVKKYSDQINEDFNLIILGEGEKRKELENYIEKNKIKNFYLLGFKDNPYKYLAKSDVYICSSLWEEPGHTLMEAGYLNVPILSSNCPNGPDEIIKNNFNGLKYELGNEVDFLEKMKKISNLNKIEKNKLLINMKKTIMNYTKFRFSKNIEKIINY